MEETAQLWEKAAAARVPQPSEPAMQLLRSDAETLANKQVRERLIDDEIRLIVADAIASGETLRMGSHVKRLAETYANGTISRQQIGNDLILAAARANVPLEMDQTE
jgi:hypothetical protein